jgi:hypothetical protein
VLFELPLTVPANTAAATPASASIITWGGILHRVIVLNPPGCRGLVKTYLVHEGHQFAPSTRGQTFYGDGVPIEYDEYYPLAPGRSRITMYGYSPGALQPHTVTAWLAILPESDIKPEIVFRDIKEGIERLLRVAGVRVD